MSSLENKVLVSLVGLKQTHLLYGKIEIFVFERNLNACFSSRVQFPYHTLFENMDIYLIIEWGIYYFNNQESRGSGQKSN